MRITIDLDCCDPCGLVVFCLGLIHEVAGTVAPTPQYHKRSKRTPIMAFKMTDTQQVSVSPKFLDKKGNPAQVDGPPEWLTDNSDVLALEPATDGLSCLVKAVGALGTGTVTVRADADLGTGVVPLIGTLEIEITGSMAMQVALTPGTPTEQP